MNNTQPSQTVKYYIATTDGAGGGSLGSLQQSYDLGNSVTAGDARDVDFTLANTATDSNFDVNISSGSTSAFRVQNAGTDVLNVGSTGLLATSASNIPGAFNRTGNDGTIISLRQDGTEEGTISVSGTTVSYNAFTGSHYAETERPLERGTLVRQNGQNSRLNDRGESELIYGVEPTAKANDPAAMGSYLSVLQPKEKDGQDKAESTSNPSLVMAVGNGELYVVQEGESDKLNPGDNLISSDTSGHAMADPGSYTVSHVVAKVAEPVDWSQVTERVNGKKRKKISVFFTQFDVRGETAIDNNLKELNQKVTELEKQSSDDASKDEFKQLSDKVDELGKKQPISAEDNQAIRTELESITKRAEEVAAQAKSAEDKANAATATADALTKQVKEVSDNLGKRVDDLAEQIKQVSDKLTGVEQKADKAQQSADEANKKAAELEKRPANAGTDEATKKQVSDLNGKVAELEKRPTTQGTPVASENPATQQQIENLRAQVERLEQNRLTDKDTSAEQAGQIAQKAASGPYPTPDQVLPSVNKSASGGVAQQVQAAGEGTALGLATSDGKIVSNASGANAFELVTTEKVGGNENLLAIKDTDQAKFVIDKNGKISTQSVGTAALEDKAVTSAKLNPGKVDFRLATGDDVQVTATEFTDLGNDYSYKSGSTAETLILNGRLMAKNAEGVGARIVAEVDGKTVECNESFAYSDNWTTISVPCTLDVPANTTIKIKWQVQAGDGGTATVFRKTDKAAPYINGFATAK